jgi:hypothetical protein
MPRSMTSAGNPGVCGKAQQAAGQDRQSEGIMSELISALRDLLRATDEEATARAAYQGYDWGYHGFQLGEAKRAAEEDFERELTAFIDKRIDRAKEPT